MTPRARSGTGGATDRQEARIARNDESLHRAWSGDNQDWWDWYLTLADNEGEARETVHVPARDLPMATDEALAAELAAPFAVTDDEAQAFRHRGYVKLKDVLSPGAVGRLNAVLVRLLQDAFPEGEDGGAANRFQTLEMAWLNDAEMAAFVLSPRIAGIAAALLGAGAVRLYHDNVLSKGPGCGRTPWHHDDHHFPLATDDVVTCWMPTHALPMPMGPLAFAHPLSVGELVRDVAFEERGQGYDEAVAARFAQAGVAVDAAPFDVGEMSFHHNRSFHTAGPNRTDRPRLVFSNTYYADGARVVERPTLVSGDWQKFLPDTAPGEIAATPLNPICWPPHHEEEGNN